MKQVNLLPAWYLNKGRDRQRTRLHIAGVGGSLLVLGAAALGIRAYVASVSNRAANIKVPANSVRVATGLQAQRRQYAKLRRLQLAARDVGTPLPMAQLLGRIFERMPRGVAIQHLGVVVKRKAISKGSGKHADVRYRLSVRVRILGVAPRMRSVTGFMQRLGHDPLLARAIFSSQPAIVRHRMVRLFNLSFHVRMDNLYNQPPMPGSLADAR